MVQAEEVAAEITRKLEKQEKKRLKKEKKRLAALALASSENSSTPEECEVSPVWIPGCRLLNRRTQDIKPWS